MGKYEIRYSRTEYGKKEIIATSREEARELFWDSDFYDGYYDSGDTDIDEIEVIEEDTQTQID